MTTFEKWAAEVEADARALDYETMLNCLVLGLAMERAGCAAQVEQYARYCGQGVAWHLRKLGVTLSETEMTGSTVAILAKTSPRAALRMAAQNLLTADSMSEVGLGTRPLATAGHMLYGASDWIEEGR